MSTLSLVMDAVVLGCTVLNVVLAVRVHLSAARRATAFIRVCEENEALRKRLDLLINANIELLGKAN